MNRSWTLTLALLALAPAALAQQPGNTPTRKTATPAPGADGPAAKPAEPRKVNIDFKLVPFRDAVRLLFENAGVPYTIDPRLENTPITLKLGDADLDEAVRHLMRVGQPLHALPLRVIKDGKVYAVTLVQELPGSPSAPAPAAEEMRFARMPVRFGRADDLLTRLDRALLPPGIQTIRPHVPDNSLLVRGTSAAMEELAQILRAVDVPAPQVEIEIEVAGKLDEIRPMRTTARTLSGSRATLTEQSVDPSPSGAVTAQLQVDVRPTLQGDGTLLVESEWLLEMPVGGGGRVVKRFTHAARVRSGDTLTVASVTAPGKATPVAVLLLTPTLVPDRK